MKTASELALEYWDKPPIERVNTTLQDYVYDYMLDNIQEQQKIIAMQECGATEIKMILDDVEYDDATKINRIQELD